MDKKDFPATLDELVRDLTSVEYRSKSATRRKIIEFVKDFAESVKLERPMVGDSFDNSSRFSYGRAIEDQEAKIQEQLTKRGIASE